MKRRLTKIVSLILLVSFLTDTACYGLATFPASRNAPAKLEILAALHRNNLIYAESDATQRLLRANNASCLLLSCGKYLVTKEVAKNDILLLRAIAHEDIEALMQIIAKEDRYKYQGIKELILKYFPPEKSNTLPIELYVNHTVAKAFEWINLLREGFVLEDEIPSTERAFIESITPIISAHKHNYFTAEFWDSNIRGEKIRVARNNGMRFYQVASTNPKPDELKEYVENNILPLGEDADINKIGNKAKSFVAFRSLGLAYPKGFVISADLVRKIMGEDKIILDAVADKMVALFNITEKGEVFIKNKTIEQGSEELKKLEGEINDLLSKIKSLTKEYETESSYKKRDSGSHLDADGSLDTIDPVYYEKREIYSKINDCRNDLRTAQKELRKAGFLMSVRSSPAISIPGLLKTRTEIGNREELIEAIQDVARSWNNDGTRRIIQALNILDESAMAIVIQDMVYGDINDNSGSGVVSSRNPDTGNKEITGNFRVKQKCDVVVSGTSRETGLGLLKTQFPKIYKQLEESLSKLEKQLRYAQEVEFVVENSVLYFLQTRNVKFTPRAEAIFIKNAVKEGVISELNAVSKFEALNSRVDNRKIYKIKEGIKKEVIARGSASKNGAMVGKVAFSIEKAEMISSGGDRVILIISDINSAIDFIDRIFKIPSIGLIINGGNLSSHLTDLARLAGMPFAIIKESSWSGRRTSDLAWIHINEKGILEESIVGISSDDGEIFFTKDEDVLVEDKAILDASFGIDIIEYGKKFIKPYMTKDGINIRGIYDYKDLIYRNLIAWIKFLRLQDDESKRREAFIANLDKHFLHRLLLMSAAERNITKEEANKDLVRMIEEFESVAKYIAGFLGISEKDVIKVSSLIIEKNHNRLAKAGYEDLQPVIQESKTPAYDDEIAAILEKNPRLAKWEFKGLQPIDQEPKAPAYDNKMTASAINKEYNLILSSVDNEGALVMTSRYNFNKFIEEKTCDETVFAQASINECMDNASRQTDNKRKLKLDSIIIGYIKRFKGILLSTDLTIESFLSTIENGPTQKEGYVLLEDGRSIELGDRDGIARSIYNGHLSSTTMDEDLDYPTGDYGAIKEYYYNPKDNPKPLSNILDINFIMGSVYVKEPTDEKGFVRRITGNENAKFSKRIYANLLRKEYIHKLEEWSAKGYGSANLILGEKIAYLLLKYKNIHLNASEPLPEDRRWLNRDMDYFLSYHGLKELLRSRLKLDSFLAILKSGSAKEEPVFIRPGGLLDIDLFSKFLEKEVSSLGDMYFTSAVVGSSVYLADEEGLIDLKNISDIDLFIQPSKQTPSFERQKKDTLHKLVKKIRGKLEDDFNVKILKQKEKDTATIEIVDKLNDENKIELNMRLCKKISRTLLDIIRDSMHRAVKGESITPMKKIKKYLGSIYYLEGKTDKFIDTKKRLLSVLDKTDEGREKALVELAKEIKWPADEIRDLFDIGNDKMLLTAIENNIFRPQLKEPNLPRSQTIGSVLTTDGRVLPLGGDFDWHTYVDGDQVIQFEDGWTNVIGQVKEYNYDYEKRGKSISKGNINEQEEIHHVLEKAANEGRMFAIMPKDLKKLKALSSHNKRLAELFIKNLAELKSKGDTRNKIIRKLKVPLFKKNLIKGFTLMSESLSLKDRALPPDKQIRLCIIIEDEGLPAIIFKNINNYLFAHGGQGKGSYFYDHFYNCIHIYVGYNSLNFALAKGRENDFKEIINYELRGILNRPRDPKETVKIDEFYVELIKTFDLEITKNLLQQLIKESIQKHGINNTVLAFDIDGTLNASRNNPLDDEITKKLSKLLEVGVNIQIITGKSREELEETYKIFGPFIELLRKEDKLNLIGNMTAYASDGASKYTFDNDGKLCLDSAYSRPFTNEEAKILDETAKEMADELEKTYHLSKNGIIPFRKNFENLKYNFSPYGNRKEDKEQYGFEKDAEKAKQYSPRRKTRKEIGEILIEKLKSRGINDIDYIVSGSTTVGLVRKGSDKARACKDILAGGKFVFYVGDEAGQGNDVLIAELANKRHADKKDDLLVVSVDPRRPLAKYQKVLWLGKNFDGTKYFLDEAIKVFAKNLSRGQIDETHPVLSNLDAGVSVDTQNATVLLSDLLYTQLCEDRVYEIKYDASRFSSSQIAIIEEYIKLMKARASNPENIKSKPFSGEKGSKESLIAVYCIDKNLKIIGEGHVDAAIQEGDLKDYLLRITGMLNIALASSNIPDNLAKDEIDKYRPTISYIKNQYKDMLGEELAIPDSPEDLLKVIRRITLGLPKSMRTDLNKIEEYNRLAKEALTAA